MTGEPNTNAKSTVEQLKGFLRKALGILLLCWIAGFCCVPCRSYSPIHFVIFAAAAAAAAVAAELCECQLCQTVAAG